MSRIARRATVLPALAGSMATLGPVAAAQASNASLRTTVKSDVPRILHSQARILDGLAVLAKTKSVKPLLHAIRAQDRNLSALKVKLSGQSASSATGMKGKHDIIRGLTLVTHANSTLVRDLAKAASGRAVSKAQVKAASTATKRGNVDINLGGKLLKA